MTKLDHNRPYFKLIDNLYRELLGSRAGAQANGNKAEIALSVTQIKKPRWSADASVEMKADLHRLACLVLAHVGKHRDVRLVTRLVDAVPGRYKASLKAWFEAFGPIAFVGDDAQYTPNRILLSNAIDAPFWLAERKSRKKASNK